MRALRSLCKADINRLLNRISETNLTRRRSP